MALAEAVKTGVGTRDRRSCGTLSAVCLPERIDDVLAGSPIGLGAQNMHWEARGALHGRGFRARCWSTPAAPT